MFDARAHTIPTSLATWLTIALVLSGLAAPAPAQAVATKHAAGVEAKPTPVDLFPSDRVLEVRITLAESDWDTIRYQRRTFRSALQEERKLGPIPHPYSYVTADVKIDGVELRGVGLRKKGFIGSQNTDAPSLKLKLNHADDNGGIDGITHLTFNNNQQDTSLVSQFLGYAVFRAAGCPAPRCAYARVTVNGRDLGIYSHVESVRRPMIKRWFGSTEGTLYEGTLVDFHPGWAESFERKFGADKPGRRMIERLIEVLQPPKSGSESAQETAIAAIVDLDSFYKFWVVEGLLGFWDGYSGNTNNFFVYLHPVTGKFHFLPWGADSMFEKHSRFRREPQGPLAVKVRGLVAHRLYQFESVRKRYAESLRSILQKHWNEKALLAEIDRIEAMLGPKLEPHLDRRHARFESSLDRVRTFVRSRRAELLAEIADGMPLWTLEPPPPFVMGADRRWRENWREN